MKQKDNKVRFARYDIVRVKVPTDAKEVSYTTERRYAHRHGCVVEDSQPGKRVPIRFNDGKFIKLMPATLVRVK